MTRDLTAVTEDTPLNEVAELLSLRALTGIPVVNEKNDIHIAEIANAPFVRPDLEQLVSGLEFIRNPDNNYPIRGTFKG